MSRSPLIHANNLYKRDGIIVIRSITCIELELYIYIYISHIDTYIYVF